MSSNLPMQFNWRGISSSRVAARAAFVDLDRAFEPDRAPIVCLPAPASVHRGYVEPAVVARYIAATPVQPVVAPAAEPVSETMADAFASAIQAFASDAPVVPAVVAPAPVVVARPVDRPRPARKPTKLGAEAFWSLRRQAVAGIRAVFGEGWAVRAPHGDTVLATVPSKLRSYKTERGTTIRYRADHRLPAAQYWPDGALPAELTLGVDPARETGPVRDASNHWQDKEDHPEAE